MWNKVNNFLNVIVFLLFLFLIVSIFKTGESFFEKGYLPSCSACLGGNYYLSAVFGLGFIAALIWLFWDWTEVPMVLYLSFLIYLYRSPDSDILRPEYLRFICQASFWGLSIIAILRKIFH